MKKQMTVLAQRRKWLKQLQRLNFKNYTDEQLTYTFHWQLLVKGWLGWKVLMLIIDLYFIGECYLWLAFENFYNVGLTTALPINIVLLLILFTNIVFRIFMTPRLPSQLVQGLQKRNQTLLMIQHYIRYNLNGWEAAIDVLFFISFLLPYDSAKYLHLVYTFKFIILRTLATQIYSAIHTITSLRVIYHLLVLFVLILYLSHFLGCIFYAIDQILIDLQFFGDPALNPNLYYQTVSLTYTPIEMLSQYGKYIMALYFANGLVTTIAYGDIVGRNYIQDAYIAILMIVSTIIVAFLLEEFLIMLKDNSFEVFEIIKKFRHLRLAMKLKKVPTQLQLRIRNFIFYIEYYDKFKNPSQIVQKLSNKMQLDLYQSGYGPQLAPILKPLGLDNIRTVCRYLKEVTYQPQLDIFTPQPKERTKDSSSQHSHGFQIQRTSYIYVLKGKALQYLAWNASSKEFKIDQAIKSINLFEFFTETCVRFGLRSKTILKCVTLSRDDLSVLLSEDSHTHKRVKQQKQQLLSCCIDRSRFQDACSICRNSDHSIFNCPEIFFVVDYNIAQAYKIDEVLREKSNPRRPKQRKHTKSQKHYNTLHFSVVLEKLNFLSLFQGQQQPQQHQNTQDIAVSLIKKMLKDICEKTLALDLSQDDASADSCYDQNGLDPLWSLQ